MYCWNCGTKLPENAGFCFACGRSQAEGAQVDAGNNHPASQPSATTSAPSQIAEPPILFAPPAAPQRDWRPSSTSWTEAEPVPPNRIAGFLGLGAAILVIVGSFAPWVTVSVFIGTVEVNGMDGDGKITLCCGLVAAALLAIHLFAGSYPTWTAFLATAAFLLSGIIGAVDWNDVNDLLASSEEDLDFGVLARVGWGLQVMTISSYAGALLAGIQGILSLKR